MNTFSEIILWLIIALYTLGAMGTVAMVGKEQTIKPEVAALRVFITVCAISGLLFVLWSNR